MNRDETLRLLRMAYFQWTREYPAEDIDQEDCHLYQIQATLGLPKNITGIENPSETTDL